MPFNRPDGISNSYRQHYDAANPPYNTRAAASRLAQVKATDLTTSNHAYTVIQGMRHPMPMSPPPTLCTKQYLEGIASHAAKSTAQVVNVQDTAYITSPYLPESPEDDALGLLYLIDQKPNLNPQHHVLIPAPAVESATPPYRPEKLEDDALWHLHFVYRQQSHPPLQQHNDSIPMQAESPHAALDANERELFDINNHDDVQPYPYDLQPEELEAIEWLSNELKNG